MKNLKELLSENITSKPDVLQFAKDRKYEESWIIPINSARPSDDEVLSYLQKDKFDTLIVEYIWNAQDDDNRFVLTLFLDKNCQLKDPKIFVEISLGLFYKYQNFKTLIEIVDKKIIGHEYMLNYPVDSVNMSIFNHWLTVRPVELWQKGDVFNISDIKSKISARPEIEKAKLNYQGLLFRFNTTGNLNGPYYGIKTPCCNKIGNIWIVDFEKVDYWMKVMID